MGVQKGFGCHVWDIPQSAASEVIKFDYLSQAFGIAASCFGRLAFIIYLLGVLRPGRLQRIGMYLLIGTQIITNTLSLFIMFLQCPEQGSAIWDRPGKQQCWDIHVQAYYAFFQGGTNPSIRNCLICIMSADSHLRNNTAINSATDLSLAVYPTYIFWSLHMATRTKAGLMILMGLGML